MRKRETREQRKQKEEREKELREAREKATRDLMELVRRLTFVMEKPGVPPEVAGLFLLEKWPLVFSGVNAVYLWSFAEHAPGRPVDPERASWLHAWETLTREITGRNPPDLDEAQYPGLVQYLNDVQVRPLLSAPEYEGTSISFESRAKAVRALKDTPGRTRRAEKLAAEYLWEHYPDSRSQQWLADLCQDERSGDMKEIRAERPTKAAEIEADRAKAYKRVSRARAIRRSVKPSRTKQLRQKKRTKKPISR
ncbi:MAG: hypothetical protein IT186_15915 [Acidobacteria bacterium]|nr:hypothetical protein [Acidobacteriota bacterium]